MWELAWLFKLFCIYVEEVKISCQTISSGCCLPANYLLQVSLLLSYCLSLHGNYRILKMQLSYSSFLKLTHLLQDSVEKTGERVGGERKKTSSVFLMFWKLLLLSWMLVSSNFVPFKHWNVIFFILTTSERQHGLLLEFLSSVEGISNEFLLWMKYLK